MSKLVAIDTSVLVGILNPRDHWHEVATRLMETILSRPDMELIVFDCVLAETVSVICRRLAEKQRSADARSFLQRIEAEFPPETITWILPQMPAFYYAVLTLMRETSGRLNFNDWLIALSCKSAQISNIATFDGDFALVPWVHCLRVE